MEKLKVKLFVIYVGKLFDMWGENWEDLGLFFMEWFFMGFSKFLKIVKDITWSSEFPISWFIKKLITYFRMGNIDISELFIRLPFNYCLTLLGKLDSLKIKWFKYYSPANPAWMANSEKNKSILALDARVSVDNKIQMRHLFQ